MTASRSRSARRGTAGIAEPDGVFDARRLEGELRERVDGEVRFDAGSRAAYSTDGSNFRQVPIGVVVPRTPQAAADAVAVRRGPVS
jgi:hypothetical protein